MTLLFSLVVAANANSQTIPLDSALQLGTRVRVFTPTVPPGKISGSVERIGNGSLYIWTDARGVRPVPLAAVDSVQLSRGKRHLTAAFLGVFVGAATGAATLGGLGYIASRNCTGECLPGGILGAMFGAVLGAPVGAVVMGIRGIDVWTTVWPPPAHSSTTRQGSSVNVSVPSAR